jgi:hypothetical protein
MILVVADVSPLRYLVEIGYESLLPRLFAKACIPGTVLAELRHKRTPAALAGGPNSFPPGLRCDTSGVLLTRMNWRALTAANGRRLNLPGRSRWVSWLKPLDPVSFLSTRRRPSSRNELVRESKDRPGGPPHHVR